MPPNFPTSSDCCILCAPLDKNYTSTTSSLKPSVFVAAMAFGKSY